jgi:hypothetical protein
VFNKSKSRLLLSAGVLTSLCFATALRAQSPPATNDYDALVQALETTTPLPASDAPRFGSFYTIQHGEAWPPLPADIMNVPFWDLGGGFYILDTRNYVAPAESQSTGRFRMDDDFEPYLSTNSFTTNDLGLKITGITNGIASLVIYPPWNVTNGVYDVEYRTNPLPPESWHWVLRTDPGQTNLSVPGATNSEGFYRLGPPNDLTANDSLGTNFWLAFPGMGSQASNVLSLYISGPVGTSGTVTIPNQSNAPVLVLSGSGETYVNGTYILTNEIVYLSEYGAGETAITGAYTNGNLLIFFVTNNAWILADSSIPGALYYGTGYFANDLNLNDVTWVDPYDTLTPPAPTNFCAEGPLVQTFSVGSSGVTKVPIPLYAMIFNSNRAELGHGINVTANAPVSVYGLDYEPTLSAAFTGYPTALLGTNYCVLARAGSKPPYMGTYYSSWSECAIVATADNTTVTITPSATAGLSGLSGGGPFTNVLDQGQTYQVRSSNYTNDVTGTMISSDKPVAVFAGANVAYVPDTNTQAGNPLVQQQIPVSDWGTEALALSFAGRLNGASYRILVAKNDTVTSVTGGVITVLNENLPFGPWTVITNNGTVSVTNQAGQFYDIIVDGPVEFQATQPIEVAQFANGEISDTPANRYGDPCEMLLPAVDHYLQTNIVFCPPNDNESGDFAENYLNIIVVQSSITNTMVDGTNLPATSFKEIGTSGFYGTQITLTTTGSHKVTSSQPVGVEAYGWGNTDAYGYFGGIVK